MGNPSDPKPTGTTPLPDNDRQCERSGGDSFPVESGALFEGDRPDISLSHANLIDQMPIGVIIAEAPSGRCILINRRMREIWKHPIPTTELSSAGEDFQGFHVDWRPYRIDEWPLARTLATGEVIRNEEVEILRGDGSKGAVYVSSSPVRDDAGVICYGVVIVSDITEQKRAEENLQQITVALQRSNQELERFAYVASHDLREPLRMVTSFSQLLAERYSGRLDEDADEFIGYITEGAARMDLLVNDLLEYSRVGSRARPLEPTNLNLVLGDALRNLAVSIEENDADIRWEVLPTVLADHTQMIQVFQNLLSNAIKFHGEEPPVIRIGAWQDGDAWLISVKDNGIGIDPLYAEKIFEIFQRLHNRDKYPGTGIGLAICRRIVERHGGRIWVDSAEGEGSTFTFTLPVMQVQGPGPGEWRRSG
jgi:signal transduction histidine kinase